MLPRQNDEAPYDDEIRTNILRPLLSASGTTCANRQHNRHSKMALRIAFVSALRTGTDIGVRNARTLGTAGAILFRDNNVLCLIENK